MRGLDRQVLSDVDALFRMRRFAREQISGAPSTNQILIAAQFADVAAGRRRAARRSVRQRGCAWIIATALDDQCECEGGTAGSSRRKAGPMAVVRVPSSPECRARLTTPIVVCAVGA